MNSIQVYNLLQEIAATSSRNAKEDLLRKSIGDPLVQRVVRLAYDPFITFGVTPPQVTKFSTWTFDADTVEPFDMLEGAARARLTGNAAKDAVKLMLELHDDRPPSCCAGSWRRTCAAGSPRRRSTWSCRTRCRPSTSCSPRPTRRSASRRSRSRGRTQARRLPRLSLVSAGVSKAFSRVGQPLPAARLGRPVPRADGRERPGQAPERRELPELTDRRAGSSGRAGRRRGSVGGDRRRGRVRLLQDHLG